MTDTPAVDTAPEILTGGEFLRRFRWLIFHTWNIPPIFGLTFILIIGVLTPAQLLGILLTPLEPSYILVWLAFALWYLPRHMRPLPDWLDAKPGSSPEAALQAMRRFPLKFWSVFLIYLAVAPLSVVGSAHLYTDYHATPIDLFRIELVALIVSIIVGLPIFFLMLDLFGRAIGGIDLRRPFVTIRTKVFLIGALVPLLIDTMLVQYYWVRTGFFGLETFGIWLILEGLAIGGSLIFAHSFGQSLAPLRTSLASADPLAAGTLAALVPQSTDELGMLTHRYRQALDELHMRTEVLEINNRLLREAHASSATADIVAEVIHLCHEAVGGDQAFLLLLDPSGTILVGAAQSGQPYKPEGHFQVSMEENSMAVAAVKTGETIAIADCASDPRVSPRMRERFNIQSALATPLRAGGQIIGVLMTSTQSAHHEYSRREIHLLEALGREVAVAIDTQRLRDAQAAAEAARREREEQVELLLDSTAEAIYGVDARGLCTFVNPACIRMLGYQTEEQLLGKNMHALIHHTYPDGRPYPKEDCLVRRSVLQGKSAHSDEEVHWRADGSSFPVEYWSHPMYRGGQLVGAVVTFFDISERKRSQQILAQHNVLLRTIASVNEMLMREFDERQTMAQVCEILVEENQFRMAWIGMVEPDGIQVKPVAEAGFKEGYLKQIDVRCDESPQGQGPTGMAIRLGETVVNEDTETNQRFAPWRERARTQGYRSSAATPLRIGGKVAGAINVYSAQAHAFGPDATVLLEKLATDLGYALARRAAEAALRESEARISLLLNSTAEGIYGVNAEGLCIFVNPACLHMLGYEHESDLIGKSMHALIHHTYPDGRPYHKDECLVRVSLLQGQPAHSAEEVHWRADGSSFPVEYWSHPMYRDGKLVGAVVTFVDITERVAAEEKLHELNTTLEQRVAERTAELALINRELEAFSYSVSHDLRAPLRAIDGFSQALLEDCAEQLDDTGKHYLNRVRGAAQRMSTLIDDLLKLSRVSRAPMQPAAVDLAPLAREIIDDLRRTQPERSVTVSIQDPLAVTGDPGLLRSALENLIGNAWKYTARRADATIEIGATASDGETIFFVRDNGAGFDMQYADKLFGAFQRLHHPSEFEGSGIGLATVQRIIHRHGGRVWAEGETGKGAVFYFTLGPAPGHNR